MTHMTAQEVRSTVKEMRQALDLLQVQGEQNIMCLMFLYRKCEELEKGTKEDESH